MYLTVKAFLSESISVAMLIGIITLIGGLTHIAYANKRQISPRFGAVLCIVGFAFMSPKGCSNMATREVLNTETQVVYEILEQNDSFVSPNE
ncbi:hypothetical protein VFMJ11_B0126 (plasmid) [Aliivibrio fischeri MJ11]|uniref:Uncharacterized protein n=2 Tax=Aliivibrio fischeri TaxID=668 RepID=B5EW69_ALIFM|nr:hypothetical protein VFMJ11_B0126 [Aliivibrio fischeri MJ11]